MTLDFWTFFFEKSWNICKKGIIIHELKTEVKVEFFSLVGALLH